MIKGVTHAHLGPIWYHYEPSDISYSPNQFLALDFFAISYSKTALGNGVIHKSNMTLLSLSYPRKIFIREWAVLKECATMYIELSLPNLSYSVTTWPTQGRALTYPSFQKLAFAW